MINSSASSRATIAKNESVDDLSNKNCLQILVGLTTIRIYYLKSGFYISLVNMEEIIPRFYKKAYQARNYLTSILENKTNVDVRFFYSILTPNDKKIKILDMNGYYSGDIEKVIYKSLLLLID